ncbi:MAG: substrate-binding domain-containing protein [Spirochaetales bacterium]|nr:substrate-binding domain-containing protein [Spirochaetales bacterium]
MSKLANSGTTIGLFIEWTNNPYHLAMIRGIREALSKHDTNLIIYVGGTLNSPFTSEVNRNIVYSIADPYQIDGLIISAASLMRTSDITTLSEFCQGLTSFPLVTIGQAVPDIHFVGTDNTIGMQELMDHLINVHNYRKFVFLKGPDGNRDSEERCEVYKKSLLEHGIHFSQEHIFNGYFMYEHAVRITRELLDNRKNDFDVIVCANDDMAIGVLSVLQERHISVPRDIAVVGFDDQEITQFLSAPLTTVSQQVQMQGFVAAESCISIINGEKIDKSILLPSCFVRRHSCGCSLFPHINHYNYNETQDNKEKEYDIKTEVQRIIISLKTQKYLDSKIHENLAASAITGIIKSIKSDSKDDFLNAMEKLFSLSESFTLTHHSINDLYTIIRDAIIPYISTNERRKFIDHLLGIAAARQADKQHRNTEYRRKIEEREIDGLLRTIEELVATIDLENLAKLLKSILPRFGIHNFYLSLYENPESDKSLSVSQLIFKFTEDGEIYHPRTRILFPTNILCPHYTVPENRKFSLYVEPLFFGQTKLGFCVFEYKYSGETSWYSVTRIFIAMALKAAFYVQKVQLYTAQYEKEVTNRTEALSKANESLTRLYNAQKIAEAKVRQLNEELGKRVQERTSELEDSNTQLLETLNRLKTTQAKLIEVEKMAALGSLVAGIAHEINTPLGISVTAASHMDSMAENILHLYEINNLRRSDLEKYFITSKEASSLVLANLKRAYKLISNFKKIAVDQSNEERREINIKDYLDEIILSLQPKLKKTKHTIKILCSRDIIIVSNPGAFYQIVTNLIINSLIHGFEFIEAGKITIKIQRHKDKLLFKYYDNGSGIKKEDLKRIFNPFYTTKRNKGGTGLGLHLVYNIVTQTLKGTITCISRSGEGVLFKITIPLTGTN